MTFSLTCKQSSTDAAAWSKPSRGTSDERGGWADTQLGKEIQKAPNSTLSHCLIVLAPDDVREDVIEAVYAAYFEHGQDIGDPEVLIEIGEKFGMNAEQLRAQLDAEDVRAEVAAEAQQSQQLGITGVPFFIINDKYAFSGAQPPEMISNVLREVQEREKGELK